VLMGGFMLFVILFCDLWCFFYFDFEVDMSGVCYSILLLRCWVVFFYRVATSPDHFLILPWP